MSKIIYCHWQFQENAKPLVHALFWHSTMPQDCAKTLQQLEDGIVLSISEVCINLDSGDTCRCTWIFKLETVLPIVKQFNAKLVRNTKELCAAIKPSTDKSSASRVCPYIMVSIESQKLETQEQTWTNVPSVAIDFGGFRKSRMDGNKTCWMVHSRWDHAVSASASSSWSISSSSVVQFLF